MDESDARFQVLGDHAYPVGDQFVVLNRGRLLGSWTRDQITRDELTSAMAGGVEFEELTRPLQPRSSADDRVNGNHR